MELRDVVSKYMKAQHAAFKSGTILKAWHKAGIRPINPDIFMETDYAPSYSSSTQMHIPESFPRKMPSVPDASSDDGIFDPSTATPSDPFDEDYCAFNSEDENNCMSCSDSNTIQDEDMETEGISWEDEDDEQNLTMTNQSSSEISIQAPVPQHHASSSQQTCPRWLDPTLEEEYIVPAQPQRLQQSVMAHASLSPAPRSQLLPDPFLDSGRQTRSSSRSNHSDRSTPFMSTPSASSQFIRSKAVLERENKELRCELGQVKAQHDAAETHAVFASRQAAVAQYKLNKSKEKAAYKSMRFPTSSWLVTLEKGHSEAKEYGETRQRKLDAAEKKKRDRKAKEHDDLIRRSTQVKTMTFTGSLLSKNKTELGDLAAALDIPSEGLTVIKLREDISQYFMDHPEMKLDE
ncbi:hypothetical protein IW262DRAFT_1460528 [Armillaria fumosa]|nr:hypothetical protein IW262DRAFT_1460528 [Armillaria fumosa]